MKAALGRTVVALVLGAAAAVLVVQDPAQLGFCLPGTENDDSLTAIYLHHQFHDAILAGRVLLNDPTQFAPTGFWRAPTDGGNSLEFVLSGLFRMFLPWPTWLSVAALAWIPLNVAAFVPLGRRLWGATGPALAAGIAWACMPHILVQIGAGRLTQAVLIGIPITVVGLLDLAEKGGRRAIWTTGLGMALVAWSYWFYAIFLSILALVFLFLLHRPFKAVLTDAIKAAGIALCAALPLAIVVFWPALSGGEMPRPPISAASASPFFPDSLRLWGEQPLELRGWFPWILAPGFALTAWRGKRRVLWASLSALSLLFALGPAQTVGEQGLLLPYYVLWRWLPGMDQMLHPDRWVDLGGLFLVIAATDGLGQLARKNGWARWAIWLLPLGVLAQFRMTGALPNWEPQIPQAYQALDRRSGAGVIVVPVLRAPLSSAYQPFFGRSLLGGMVENQAWYMPSAQQKFIEQNGLLMALHGLVTGRASALQAHTDDLEELQEAGFDTVLFDSAAWLRVTEPSKARDPIARISEALGQPWYAGHGDAIWSLPTDGKPGRGANAGDSLGLIGPPGPDPRATPTR